MFFRLPLPRLLFALLALAAVPSVGAECPMQKTLVSGRVHSDNQPVAGALVKVIWDEQRIRNLSAETRSGADGGFELTLSFSSFDGRTLLAKEKCGYQPKEFEVEVRHDNFRNFRKIYNLAKLEKPLSIKLRPR